MSGGGHWDQQPRKRVLGYEESTIWDDRARSGGRGTRRRYRHKALKGGQTKQAAVRVGQSLKTQNMNQIRNSSIQDGHGATGKHIQGRLQDSTKSTILISIALGNSHPMQCSAVSRPSSSTLHSTLGRIECDSQNWTRRRSRSSHFLAISSPTTPVTLVRISKVAKLIGRQMEICRRSSCWGVMVRRASVIQPISCESYPKAISLSLVALERLIEADSNSTGDRSKLSMWTWMQISNGRTGVGVTSNVKRFEGAGTLLYQLRDPSVFFLDLPQERNLSEVKAVGWVLQLV